MNHKLGYAFLLRFNLPDFLSKRVSYRANTWRRCLKFAGGHGMSVLHRDRREGLLGSRRFRQSTLFPREYRGQGNGLRRQQFKPLRFRFVRVERLIVFFFQNIPPDLSQCVFVIEQALSVRALQELVTAAGSETVMYKFSLPNSVHSRTRILVRFQSRQRNSFSFKGYS